MSSAREASTVVRLRYSDGLVETTTATTLASAARSRTPSRSGYRSTWTCASASGIDIGASLGVDSVIDDPQNTAIGLTGEAVPWRIGNGPSVSRKLHRP